MTVTAAEVTVTAADVLRDAMELITPEGAWIQHSAYRWRPPGYCAGSAIDITADDLDARDLDQDARRAFEQAVGCENIPKWNDDPSRIHEDVLLAFKRAIEIAEDSQ